MEDGHVYAVIPGHGNIAESRGYDQGEQRDKANCREAEDYFFVVHKYPLVDVVGSIYLEKTVVGKAEEVK
jgi:hypothetical protein